MKVGPQASFAASKTFRSSCAGSSANLVKTSQKPARASADPNWAVQISSCLPAPTEQGHKGSVMGPVQGRLLCSLKFTSRHEFKRSQALSDIISFWMQYQVKFNLSHSNTSNHTSSLGCGTDGTAATALGSFERNCRIQDSLLFSCPSLKRGALIYKV